VIFNEEIVGGRERVTTARGAGTARGLNRDQIVEIARLTGCKNFVSKRKFIFKRSSFIVVLQSPCRDRAAVVASATVGVVFHVFQEDAGCLGSICLQQLDACPDGRMVLTEQCLKAPVPCFCEVASVVCVVHGDVVNVPDAGRECWSSCSVSSSHCATDILSRIEIVDQRLCKQQHYSAQKVHASLCQLLRSLLFSVSKGHLVFFVVTKRLCNLTENQ